MGHHCCNSTIVLMVDTGYSFSETLILKLKCDINCDLTEILHFDCFTCSILKLSERKSIENQNTKLRMLHAKHRISFKSQPVTLTRIKALLTCFSCVTLSVDISELALHLCLTFSFYTQVVFLQCLSFSSMFKL